jgi:hypothetical protein
LKKAAQKLLLCWAMGCDGDNAHGPTLVKFLASFCSQKEAFLFVYRRDIVLSAFLRHRILPFPAPA